MREITSKDNSLIKYTARLQSSAKLRREDKRFVSEGLRVSLEALNGGVEVETLFVTDDALSKHKNELKPLIDASREVYRIPQKLMGSICDTKSPQGVVCVLKALDNNIDFGTINNKYILLESIQDPSNLGTILRTADALGVSGVIMTDDCCDIYSPKVCRGAMGALFRVPFVHIPDAPSFIEEFNKAGNSFAAVVRNASQLTDADFSGSCLIAVGNEGNGLKDATVSACKYKVTIPMNGNAESLNAAIASGILMWEMMK